MVSQGNAHCVYIDQLINTWKQARFGHWEKINLNKGKGFKGWKSSKFLNFDSLGSGILFN